MNYVNSEDLTSPSAGRGAKGCDLSEDFKSIPSEDIFKPPGSLSSW